MGGAAAQELVPFQGGSDLKVDAIVIRASTNPVGAQDLPHATQADGLRAFAVQDNHVFDGPTEVRLSFRGEQHSTRTDVLGKTRKRHTFGTGTGNRERELELKTPGSSLFHVVLILMVGAIALRVNRTGILRGAKGTMGTHWEYGGGNSGEREESGRGARGAHPGKGFSDHLDENDDQGIERQRFDQHQAQ